ncbi:MAG: DUF3465 domain-containing protein [Candidatus Omnitrophota bacterium]
MMRKFFYCAFLGICLSSIISCGQAKAPVAAPQQEASLFVSQDELIARLFQEGQSNTFVQAQGEVIRLLSDDLEGSRHQRFIIKLKGGQTLLVSHNIDIAPRLNDLETGDTVRLRGEYLWNDKGGLVHYTHHDPAFRKDGGWIDHKGWRYK